MSQAKKLLAQLAKLSGESLRKLGFLERRQQRQLPSLGEVSREAQQAGEESWGSLLCYLVECCHFYFLANAIIGTLCCPCHFLTLLGSCMWYNCAACCCPKRRNVLELEETILQLQEQVKALQDTVEEELGEPYAYGGENGTATVREERNSRRSLA